MVREHGYYVYMLASQPNGTLYIGVTNDIFGRMLEHRAGTADSFTRKYGVTTLVWYETHAYINEAIQRETSLKRYRRTWKIKLIEESNPDWHDLFPEMQGG